MTQRQLFRILERECRKYGFSLKDSIGEEV